MLTVLESIVNFIKMSFLIIENNIFYITCFKGSITAKKETCLWNILSRTQSYIDLDWMCGLFQENYVVEDCISGCYAIVVLHSPV